MPLSYPGDLPPEEQEWRRAWHERAYAETRDATVDGEQLVEYLGRTIVVPPHVQPILPMSDVLGAPVLAEVRPGERVLDMGTGSGVNAVLAAAIAAEVVAVDVNPHAVAAARRNAERNGVADRVDVRLSDVFTAVDGRFDVILFDPPFRWFRPRDLLERASTDEGYATLTTFFREAGGHLTEHGRMLVSFGTTGDLGYLHRLCDAHGFRREVVSRRELRRDGRVLEYLTYRLTPSP